MGDLVRQKGRHNYLIRYYSNGKRITESARTSDYDEARRLLKLREGEVAKGAPVTAAIGKLKFEDAAHDVVNDYENNQRATLGHVQRRLRLHLIPYFGGRLMADISPDHVRAFVAARRKADASNAEINRELSIINRMFVLAMDAGKLYHKPKIKKLKESSPRQGFFEREQFEALHARLPEWMKGPVMFAYITGWRMQSEVLSLEWRNVDRVAKEIRLEPGTTKNAEGRTWPYAGHPHLDAVIETAHREKERLAHADTICKWVFHHNGEPLVDEADHLIYEWKTEWRAASAGLAGKIAHDFRRTAVRNLVRDTNTSEPLAMRLTGHKTRSVFDRYNIVDARDLAVAVQQLGEAQRGLLSTRQRGVARLPRGPHVGAVSRRG